MTSVMRKAIVFCLFFFLLLDSFLYILFGGGKDLWLINPFVLPFFFFFYLFSFT